MNEFSSDEVCSYSALVSIWELLDALSYYLCRMPISVLWTEICGWSLHEGVNGEKKTTNPQQSCSQVNKTTWTGDHNKDETILKNAKICKAVKWHSFYTENGERKVKGKNVLKCGYFYFNI